MKRKIKNGITNNSIYNIIEKSKSLNEFTNSACLKMLVDAIL